MTCTLFGNKCSMGGGVAIPSVEDYPDLTFYVTSYTDKTMTVKASNTDLTEANIPARVTKDGVTYTVTDIMQDAFSDCSSLTSITIPNGVTSLGYHVFDGCSSLASITFENTTGWYVTDSSDYTGGTSIDVTDPTTNATNLKSYRGSWCAKYLYRVDV